MASPMVCYEISVNGKLLNRACVSDGDQLEAALAKLAGEHDPVLNVTVFSPSSPYPTKHISWESEQIGVGDEVVIRIVEDENQSEPSVKSAEEIEAEVESKFFCSFCGKGEREVSSMIEGKDGVFICSECVELCADISKPVKKFDR